MSSQSLNIKTGNRFMSHAGLAKKVNSQQSKVKSLEMKLQHVRQKQEKEANNHEDTDNTDMLEMFDFAENSRYVEGLYSKFYLLTVFLFLMLPSSK